MHRMTLTNESVTFNRNGIWIQPLLSDRFRFTGSVVEFFAIIEANPQLDITNTHFRVQALEEDLAFCGFCRGLCDGEHYISPSTIGY